MWGAVLEVPLIWKSSSATERYVDRNRGVKQNNFGAQEGSISMWSGCRKGGEILSEEGGCLVIEASLGKMAFESHLNQMTTSAEGEWGKVHSGEIGKGRICIWSVGDGLFIMIAL